MRKTLLAAGLLAGAAALTGCTADTAPQTTPQAAQKASAEAATAKPSPDVTQETATEETPAPVALEVDGTLLAAGAINEQGDLLLPLVETGEALGWQADSETTQEETQAKRVITLEKDESRITVSWTVSDNTTKGITWQKDGLLIPVDTRITTMNDVVYVPAAFFEEAMDVRVSETETGVSVVPAEPEETPETTEQAGENG